MPRKFSFFGTRVSRCAFFGAFSDQFEYSCLGRNTSNYRASQREKGPERRNGVPVVKKEQERRSGPKRTRVNQFTNWSYNGGCLLQDRHYSVDLNFHARSTNSTHFINIKIMQLTKLQSLTNQFKWSSLLTRIEVEVFMVRYFSVSLIIAYLFIMSFILYWIIPSISSFSWSLNLIWCFSLSPFLVKFWSDQFLVTYLFDYVMFVYWAII